MFRDEQTKALAAPLHKENVKRNKRGFDYVESWFAEAEANRIFGFDGWSSVLLDCKCVVEKPRKLTSGEGFAVTYTATVRVTAGGVQRDGAGAGHGMDKDLGLAHESALKEAASDAEKRALKTFGNQFGLALYDKSRENVVAAPAPEKPISAYRAKKEGMGERAAVVAHEMTDIMAVTELLAWREGKEAEVATWPLPWQTALWENYDIHLADLRTIIARESGANEETGEMVA